MNSHGSVLEKYQIPIRCNLADTVKLFINLYIGSSVWSVSFTQFYGYPHDEVIGCEKSLQHLDNE